MEIPYNRKLNHLECKSKVIPERKGATGTISKSLRQYPSNIPAMHVIKEQIKQPFWTLYAF